MNNMLYAKDTHTNHIMQYCNSFSQPFSRCIAVTSRANPELVDLVSTATCNQDGAFFDTGERYGSHAKTALGMGWGETECLVSKLLSREAVVVDDTNNEETSSYSSSKSSSAVVATKFTPSPWRTTAESVVEACEESRRRLGVESIDLYQIQMPDIVKVSVFAIVSLEIVYL